MMNLLLFIEMLISYSCTYLFFLLMGRSFFIILKLAFNLNSNNKSTIFTKKIMYPLTGFIFFSNLLVILNFFIPLKSPLTYLIASILILINFKDLDLNLKNIFNFKIIFYYLIIPGILVISSFDINFHYDAGYYHLNSQNWIRESNIVFGLVNIFWPLGMSSVYEYISAFFWIDANFLYLHYINLFFIHNFYLFLLENLNSKNTFLKNSSIFIIIFSLLDNFGALGGRNGYIYIEGVGKQDVAVGILIYIIFIYSVMLIKNSNKFEYLDCVLYSMLILFVIQIKLNAFPVMFLYFFTIYIYHKNGYSKLKIFKSQLITLFFGFTWILKNYLTTGCLIFPLSLTCINNFKWYVFSSTETFEGVTKAYSLNYTFGLGFINWFEKFIENSLHLSLIINFLSSLIILITLRLFFFQKESVDKKIIKIAQIFVFLFFIFLFFYGPIPRYAIGGFLTSIGMLGLNTRKIKINFSQSFYYLMTTLSILLLLRVDAYSSFLNNKGIVLFDPREIAQYIDIGNDWFSPDSGDQCWINLNCTMGTSDIEINNEGYFKIAYKQ